MTGTRTRVYWKAGQFVVVYDYWNGEVDGPHKRKEAGYGYNIKDRRTIHVFDDFDVAERFAEECIAEQVEEFGDI